MTSFSSTIQLISIWGIVIPLAIGLASFRTAGFPFRLFVFFLLTGFITDISMYSLQFTRYRYCLPYILNVYSLAESCTFLWLIFHHSVWKVIRAASWWMLTLTPIVWLIAVLVAWYLNKSAGPLFDPYYEIVVSFLASFILLEMAEQPSSLMKAPVFWIFLGMFFYCFCTFFIMSFLDTLFSQRIWVVNNIINILTYIFYSVGLWHLKASRS